MCMYQCNHVHCTVHVQPRSLNIIMVPCILIILVPYLYMYIVEEKSYMYMYELFYCCILQGKLLYYSTDSQVIILDRETLKIEQNMELDGMSTDTPSPVHVTHLLSLICMCM